MGICDPRATDGVSLTERKSPARVVVVIVKSPSCGEACACVRERSKKREC